MRIRPVALVACLFAAACSHGWNPLFGVPGSAHPLVVQTGQSPTNWTQFVPFAGGSYQNIVVGPDKNLWYVNPSSNSIVRITMTGATKAIALPLQPYELAVGPDGKFYVTAGSAILQVTTSGKIASFPLPDPTDFVQYETLTTGADKNLWFGSAEYVNRLTTAGVISEYPYPSGEVGDSIGGVAAGPDGDVWFTDQYAQMVGKIAPGSTRPVEYGLGSANCEPDGIIAGSDGNLWSNCNGAASDFIRLTTAGVASSYPTTFTTSESPAAMTTGVGTDIWWVDSAGNIGTLDPATQTIASVSDYYKNDGFYGLTLGPDGNFWITSGLGHIDVYILKVLTVTPSSLSFGSIGQTLPLTVKETGVSSWTAKSSSTKCVTVAQGSKAKVFEVTSVGPGPCSVTIGDRKGNTFAVPVSVP